MMFILGILAAVVGGLVGWFIAYLIRWHRSRPSDMEPVAYRVQKFDPEWKKYKIEDPVGGGLIPVDYDPEENGEFTGDIGMIPALAAIQLGGAVLMNKVGPDKWEIIGPDGIKGEGRTPSEAYGQILKRIKQDIN